MSDETDLSILRLQAMYSALETLCVAIVKTSPERALLEARFQAHRAAWEDRLLHDGELTDEVFHEFEQAHARLAGVVFGAASKDEPQKGQSA